MVKKQSWWSFTKRTSCSKIGNRMSYQPTLNESEPNKDKIHCIMHREEKDGGFAPAEMEELSQCFLWLMHHPPFSTGEGTEMGLWMFMQRSSSNSLWLSSTTGRFFCTRGAASPSLQVPWVIDGTLLQWPAHLPWMTTGRLNLQLVLQSCSVKLGDTKVRFDGEMLKLEILLEKKRRILSHQIWCKKTIDWGGRSAAVNDDLLSQQTPWWDRCIVLCVPISTFTWFSCFLPRCARKKKAYLSHFNWWSWETAWIMIDRCRKLWLLLVL